MLSWHLCQGPDQGAECLHPEQVSPWHRLLVLWESHTAMEGPTPPALSWGRGGEWGLVQLEPLQAIGKLKRGVLFQYKSDEATTLLETLSGFLLSSQ